VINALAVGAAPTPTPSSSSTETLLTALRSRSEQTESPVASVLTASRNAVGIENAIPFQELMNNDRIIKAIEEADIKTVYLTRGASEGFAAPADPGAAEASAPPE
jgi:hypothetical protein